MKSLLQVGFFWCFIKTVNSYFTYFPGECQKKYLILSQHQNSWRCTSVPVSQFQPVPFPPHRVSGPWPTTNQTLAFSTYLHEKHSLLIQTAHLTAQRIHMTGILVTIITNKDNYNTLNVKHLYDYRRLEHSLGIRFWSVTWSIKTEASHLF